MAYHYIAIASGFSKGQRIAWHYPSEKKLDSTRINAFIERAVLIDSVQLGIHKLSTDNLKWSSVVEKDSFFGDVLATQSEEEFFRFLNEDKKISALDVARFIVGLKPMSHLKLQKILYLTYATYLSKYKDRLFDDKIVSYRYGPVVEDVYHSFKKYGAENIGDEEKYSFVLKNTSFPALFMRISNSDKGSKAIDVIIETLEKYEKYSANQLVAITHSEKSPWSYSYTEEYSNAEILDETILKYHTNEVKSLT